MRRRPFFMLPEPNFVTTCPRCLSPVTMSFDLPKEAEDRTEIKKLREKNARYHNGVINDHDLRNVDNSSDEVVGKIDQSEKNDHF